MPARTVTRLVAGASSVALRLVALRGLLPEADLSAMVGARLSLLLDDDLGEVQAAVARLRQLLPGINVDRCVRRATCCLPLHRPACAGPRLATYLLARLPPAAKLPWWCTGMPRPRSDEVEVAGGRASAGR
jgi:hypothetical protein